MSNEIPHPPFLSFHRAGRNCGCSARLSNIRTSNEDNPINQHSLCFSSCGGVATKIGTRESERGNPCPGICVSKPHTKRSLLLTLHLHPCDIMTFTKYHIVGKHLPRRGQSGTLCPTTGNVSPNQQLNP